MPVPLANKRQIIVSLPGVVESDSVRSTAGSSCQNNVAFDDHLDDELDDYLVQSPYTPSFQTARQSKHNQQGKNSPNVSHPLPQHHQTPLDITHQCQSLIDVTHQDDQTSFDMTHHHYSLLSPSLTPGHDVTPLMSQRFYQSSLKHEFPKAGCFFNPTYADPYSLYKRSKLPMPLDLSVRAEMDSIDSDPTVVSAYDHAFSLKHRTKDNQLGPDSAYPDSYTSSPKRRNKRPHLLKEQGQRKVSLSPLSSHKHCNRNQHTYEEICDMQPAIDLSDVHLEPKAVSMVTNNIIDKCRANDDANDNAPTGIFGSSPTGVSPINLPSPRSIHTPILPMVSPGSQPSCLENSPKAQIAHTVSGLLRRVSQLEEEVKLLRAQYTPRKWATKRPPLQQQPDNDNMNGDNRCTSCSHVKKPFSELSALKSHPLANLDRIRRLKRFFGAEPPILQHILTCLNYPELWRKLSQMNLGVIELIDTVPDDIVTMTALPAGPLFRTISALKFVLL